MSNGWRAVVSSGAMLAAFAITTHGAAASPPPPGSIVLLTGDSVSVHLEDALAVQMRDLQGWELVSAAVPNCSVFGDTLAWPDGTPHGDPDHCPGAVAPLQRSQVQRWDPAVVIWWDRLSTMPFISSEGEFVRGDRERFWELRTVAFDETLARLTAGGARIVFVATEPMGMGVKTWCAGWDRPACRWKRYRMRHYEDITRRENRLMRRYASEHPACRVHLDHRHDLPVERVPLRRPPPGWDVRPPGRHPLREWWGDPGLESDRPGHAERPLATGAQGRCRP